MQDADVNIIPGRQREEISESILPKRKILRERRIEIDRWRSVDYAIENLDRVSGIDFRCEEPEAEKTIGPGPCSLTEDDLPGESRFNFRRRGQSPIATGKECSDQDH